MVPVIRNSLFSFNPLFFSLLLSRIKFIGEKCYNSDTTSFVARDSYPTVPVRLLCLLLYLFLLSALRRTQVPAYIFRVPICLINLIHCFRLAVLAAIPLACGCQYSPIRLTDNDLYGWLFRRLLFLTAKVSLIRLLTPFVNDKSFLWCRGCCFHWWVNRGCIVRSMRCFPFFVAATLRVEID